MSTNAEQRTKETAGSSVEWEDVVAAADVMTQAQEMVKSLGQVGVKGGEVDSRRLVGSTGHVVWWQDSLGARVSHVEGELSSPTAQLR